MILEMKKESYADRRAAMDIIDIIFILAERNEGMGVVVDLIKKHGSPENPEDIKTVALRDEDFALFMKVVSDASKTGG